MKGHIRIFFVSIFILVVGGKAFCATEEQVIDSYEAQRIIDEFYRKNGWELGGFLYLRFVDRDPDSLTMKLEPWRPEILNTSSVITGRHIGQYVISREILRDPSFYIIIHRRIGDRDFDEKTMSLMVYLSGDDPECEKDHSCKYTSKEWYTFLASPKIRDKEDDKDAYYVVLRFPADIKMLIRDDNSWYALAYLDKEDGQKNILLNRTLVIKK